MKKLSALLPISALSLFAQSAENPMSTAIRNQFNQAKTNLTRAAEKMPAEKYSYRPTDSVRSFGELVGHIANASYNFCSGSLGDKNPNTANIEKTVSGKPELVKALNEAFAYCDKAYAALTDANASEAKKFGRNEMARLGILSFNNMHDYEHYGNIVTYMRMNNIVPPSSEPRQ